MFCPLLRNQFEDCLYYYTKVLQYFLETPGLRQRLIVSNCLLYKTQLLTYGSTLGGYSQSLKALLKVLQLPQFTSERHSILQQVLHSNPRRLLQWRQKIEEVVVEGPKWSCQQCQKISEEGKVMKFEKNDFEFCSTKCISAFRAKGGFN